MSAAARVRTARNVIVAAWECGRSALGDPATEAAQALEDRGLLQSPETAAEREAEQGNNDEAKAPWGRAEDGRPYLPEGAHWTDVPELVDRTVAGIQARVDQAQSGGWYTAPATESGLAPGTVRTRVDGYPRTVGQFTNVLPADLELILHAHGDLSWCLEMLAKFRARVAELETSSQVLPLAVDVPVPVRLTEEDGPALVTSAAMAAADKLRRTLALPGGERP
ncbi:hypothetical protein [Streptomyces cucumeris]|uniref:hypothetical protein n=1 Tax=Streptomyces cucumeris TaxID=2962890 RepID=UPI003D746890